MYVAVTVPFLHVAHHRDVWSPKWHAITETVENHKLSLWLIKHPHIFLIKSLEGIAVLKWKIKWTLKLVRSENIIPTCLDSKMRRFNWRWWLVKQMGDLKTYYWRFYLKWIVKIKRQTGLTDQREISSKKSERNCRKIWKMKPKYWYSSQVIDTVSEFSYLIEKWIVVKIKIKD